MSIDIASKTPADTGLSFSSLDIMKFYLPIAATHTLIGLVFNVINSTMTGALNAAAAVAAFAIAQAMTELIFTVSFNSPNWLVAKARDRASFWVGIRVILVNVTFNIALMVVLAWTPLGRSLFSGIFKAPAELADAITSAMKICVLMPLAMVARGCGQSVLMTTKRTHLMFVGILGRLATVVILGPVLTRQSLLKGAQIGAVMWLSSVVIEATCDCVMAARHFWELPPRPADGKLPDPRGIWAFVIPLALVGVIQALGKPVQNLGMSLTNTPALSIASYSLAWNGIWLLAAFAQDGIRQTVLVFWNNEEEFAAIKRVFLKVAMLVSAVVAGLRLTGAWAWFFRTMIGADPDLALRAQAPMLLFALYPPAICLVEMYTGRLLKSGHTSLMGISKGSNLAASFVAAHLISYLAPNAGAFVGVGCILSGFLTELAVVYWATRKVQKAIAASTPMSGKD